MSMLLVLVAGVTLSSGLPKSASSPIQLPAIQSDLKFDDLFPRKPFTGKSARGLAWSYDDRYLAYLWNGYDDKGFDIWIYDTKVKSAKRLTSMEGFAIFDLEIPKAIARYKKDKLEEEKVDKMTDDERRQYDIDQRKKNEGRREPEPSYTGPNSYVWAKRANEMLVGYKGDIYRWKIGEAKPMRLTKTREAESQVEYLPDDSGFTFRRGDGVFRMKFNDAVVEQLNPELPSGLTLGGYSLSPDGTKLMLTAGKTTGQDRQVDYITYRERFAQARKTNRGVADDKFNTESYLFLFDVNDDPMENPKVEPKPWEVWKWPGGEEYMEVSVADEPWSKDSSQFTFATWKRDKKELEVVVANIARKATKTVYKTTHDGEHRTPSLAQPFFTPDGRKIVCMLENSGWRHAWLIDPLQEGATQLTKGDFEVYPVACTGDSKELFVRSSKQDLSRFDVYRVNLESGDMHRITSRDGSYGEPALDHSQSQMAISFGSWTSMTETYLISTRGGEERAVTASHRPGFEAVNKLKPKLFSYKNRHGQTIHGYMFLPAGWKKEDRRPLMIYVYGGPLGTSKTVVDGSINSTAYLFNMYLTYALGYVTVAIDPRGQSGYGSVFGKANWDAPGVAQVEDLSDGVKHLIENYGVDPAKVGINGWSFGGFQTQMCMYSAPDVFTLGIAGAGPTEWQNYNTWYTGGVIGDSKLNDPATLDKFSLTHLAKNLKSPLLLLHGMEDTNVLFQDTVKVYRILLQYGKGPLVELALDPTGGHGLGGDISNRDRHAIYLAFILKHWGIPASRKN